MVLILKNSVFTAIVLMLLSRSNPILSELNDADIINEAKMDTMEFITQQGYPAEKHIINTDDGYKLILHRIPGRKTVGLSTSNQIPVLMMHGIFQNSNSWVDNLRDSLGFVLANEHYDVWLGNIRANEGSQHLIYKRDEAEFWDYTWDEVAKYDVTAIIEYIRKVTNRKKILYIGYSLGSLLGFALFSSKPEFNNKVAGFVALAPPMSIRYRTDFLFTAIINTAVKLKVPLLNLLHFFRCNPKSFKVLISAICTYPRIVHFVFAISAGYGAYPHSYNTSRLPLYLHHITESTSLKSLLHLQQTTPPEYNLSKIDIPVALFSAANDALISPLDVAHTKRNLKTVIVDEIIPQAMFTHLNFIWSESTHFTLYDKVKTTLRYMWETNGLVEGCRYDGSDVT
uniref:Lipase n=1 Tax=Strigamia maritima TaxID=126957 RepID=T1JN45_STRMM